MAFAALPSASMAQPILESRAQAAPDAPKRVLLLVPCMDFELLKSEAPLDPKKFDGTALAEEMASAAEHFLRSQGLVIVAEDGLPRESVESIQMVQREAGRLARGFRIEELRPALAKLADRLGARLLLAQYLRVRVGSKGYWEPLSGAIGPGQSETLLVASLIDPAAGQVVWSNKLLVRKVLRPRSPDMERSMASLFGPPVELLTH